MSFFIEVLGEIFGSSGFAYFFVGDGWKNAVMIAIACLLLYMGLVK